MAFSSVNVQVPARSINVPDYVIGQLTPVAKALYKVLGIQMVEWMSPTRGLVTVHAPHLISVRGRARAAESANAAWPPATANQVVELRARVPDFVPGRLDADTRAVYALLGIDTEVFRIRETEYTIYVPNLTEVVSRIESWVPSACGHGGGSPPSSMVTVAIGDISVPDVVRGEHTQQDAMLYAAFGLKFVTIQGGLRPAASAAIAASAESGDSVRAASSVSVAAATSAGSGNSVGCVSIHTLRVYAPQLTAVVERLGIAN